MVHVKVGPRSEGDSLVLIHQHGCHIGIAHELQAQRFEAMVHVHAVAYRVRGRDVQVDHQMIVSFVEPFTEVLVVIVPPSVLADEVLVIVMLADHSHEDVC